MTQYKKKKFVCPKLLHEFVLVLVLELVTTECWLAKWEVFGKCSITYGGMEGWQCKKKKDGWGSWWMDVCIEWIGLSYEMKFNGCWMNHDWAWHLMARAFLWGQKCTATKWKKNWRAKSKKKTCAGHSWFHRCLGWVGLRCPIKVGGLLIKHDQAGQLWFQTSICFNGANQAQKNDKKKKKRARTSVFPKAIHKHTIPV